jgi:hypothetical protein
MPDALYERDFYTWTQEQARLLRARAELQPNDAIDWAHVAEEVEDMGKDIARTIRSAYARIIEHLLKLEHSPARDPRSGWMETVIEQRIRIEEELDDNPGVRPHCDALFAKAWTSGHRLAATSLAGRDGVDPRALPADCPWTRAQVEDFDWWPVSRHAPG